MTLTRCRTMEAADYVACATRSLARGLCFQSPRRRYRCRRIPVPTAMLVDPKDVFALPEFQQSMLKHLSFA
jgi:hypothetical protein